jgi:hypothetical protein
MGHLRPANHHQPGIYRRKQNPTDPDVREADFSYENVSLAEMIVKAWTDPNFAQQLTDHTHPAFARAELEKRGVYLTDPQVLTEDEYFHTGWQKTSDDEVVFVLPNTSRAIAGKPLLETAKLLMACTPNGI